MDDTVKILDTPVFSYPLASGDMRYIEIGQREIYLRNDPDLGIVFRGEIPGCGSECFVELNEILLEYAMSCEGCREQNVAANEVSCFGEHLGKILVANSPAALGDLSPENKLSSAFEIVLNSMSSKYSTQVSPDQINFSLDCCPLRECARDTGLNRSVEMAQVSFVALCEQLINSLAPGAKLIEPTADGDSPIHQIIISLS